MPAHEKERRDITLRVGSTGHLWFCLATGNCQWNSGATVFAPFQL